MSFGIKCLSAAAIKPPLYARKILTFPNKRSWCYLSKPVARIVGHPLLAPRPPAGPRMPGAERDTQARPWSVTAEAAKPQLSTLPGRCENISILEPPELVAATVEVAWTVNGLSRRHHQNGRVASCSQERKDRERLQNAPFVPKVMVSARICAKCPTECLQNVEVCSLLTTPTIM